MFSELARSVFFFPLPLSVFQFCLFSILFFFKFYISRSHFYLILFHSFVLCVQKLKCVREKDENSGWFTVSLWTVWLRQQQLCGAGDWWGARWPWMQFPQLSLSLMMEDVLAGQWQPQLLAKDLWLAGMPGYPVQPSSSLPIYECFP